MSISATHGVKLDNGLTADKHLLSADQFEMAHEVLAQAKAAGLETIRLAFVDQHGVPRGKAITVESLASVFRNGMAMTSTLLLKDTSHRTVFDVWAGDIGFGEGQLTGAGDVLIVPDPATFRILPWSPHSASILCDLYHKDGSFMPFCSRGILKRAVSALAETGRQLVCGLEVEFYVFRIDNPRLDHADGGMPAAVPETSLLSHGFQYLTDARYDALEEVMDHLRRAAQALQLPVRSMEAEFGPSQFEFTFEPDSPLAHADAMVTFRTMVKQVCRRHGLHATFMCRPRVDNAVPSGWHLHQSLVDMGTGRNLFIPADDGTLSREASGWIGGILAHAEESCLLTTPTVNGYKRYQPNQMAPDRVQWGKDNKGAMIRGLMAPGDKASRIENRVAEPAANPYLFFASQIYSGLDGLDRELEAPAPVENPYKSKATALPRSLLGAVELFEKSEFYRNKLGPEFVAYLSHIKRAEWDRYLMTVSEWEQREYFSLF